MNTLAVWECARRVLGSATTACWHPPHTAPGPSSRGKAEQARAEGPEGGMKLSQDGCDGGDGGGGGDGGDGATTACWRTSHTAPGPSSRGKAAAEQARADGPEGGMKISQGLSCEVSFLPAAEQPQEHMHTRMQIIG
ncbi:hypothetical protein EK904_001465 [Melospiza melodia maxima]|nr:hypothetical protein EK904_001465 [Melospiza melodia maxima]